MITYVMDKTNKNIQLGLRIRLAREAKGWSQDALADELDTTQATVSGWESGTFPKRFGLPRIAEVLGKPIEWFQDASAEEDGPGMDMIFMSSTTARIEALERATDYMQIMERLSALEAAQKPSKNQTALESELLRLFRRADDTLRTSILNNTRNIVLGHQSKNRGRSGGN